MEKVLVGLGGGRKKTNNMHSGTLKSAAVNLHEASSLGGRGPVGVHVGYMNMKICSSAGGGGGVSAT